MQARAIGRRLRQLLPYAIAAIVVVVLLRQYSLAAIGRELGRPGAALVPPILLATTLVSLVVLAAADRVVLRHLLGPLGAVDLARGRAGAAMLVGIHHGLSAGGYGVWLVRVAGVELATGVGAIAYLTATDLGAAAAAALVAMSTGAQPIAALGPALPIAVGAALALVVGAGLAGPWLLAGRLGHELPGGFTAAWRRIPPGAFATGLALRVGNVAIWIAGTWLATRAFGLALPPLVFAASLPLVAIVAALPLSVGGLGAAQAAWVVAFEPWATGEELLAFQLVLHWSAAVAYLVRGLPFVRRVVREVEDGRRDGRAA